MTTTSVTKDAFCISLAVLLLGGVVAALDGGLWGYGWIVGGEITAQVGPLDEAPHGGLRYRFRPGTKVRGMVHPGTGSNPVASKEAIAEGSRAEP